MLLLAYRPGFDQVERTTLRASHTAVRLEPLSPEESVALARGFLGVGDLPADLERLVGARAEGNPFFVEELLQALLELGSLAVVDRTAVLAKVEVDVPDSVQGTILARVDRLGARERQVLQHAAVIGRSFSASLLAAVVGQEALAEALDGLARAQLLVEPAPDEWGFKHALIQEVTYETLLLRQRKEMHRRVAEALEARVGDDPAFLEALAEHYARAEVPEKARAFAIRAGDLASERMGFVEARARYETALRLWGEGDDRGRLELLTRLGWTRLMAGDGSAAKVGLTEAAEGWGALGDQQRAGGALASLGRVLWITGEGARARDVGDRAIALLEPGGPTPELARAYMWVSTQDMLMGLHDDSIERATRGLEIAQPLGLDGVRSQLLNNLGVCQGAAGDPAGVASLREALELAERSGDAEALDRAYTNLPSGLVPFGLHREAIEACERGRQAMRKLGAPNFESFIAANEAGSLIELGRYEDAEALARESLDAQRTTGAVPGIVNSGMTLVDLLTRKGRYEEGARLMDEVMPAARGLGGSQFLSQALTAQAQLEKARGNLASARQAIEEAAAIVSASTSIGDQLMVLVPAAHLIPETARGIADEVRPNTTDPGFGLPVLETDAILSGDPALFAEAADRYASFEMPYHEARCRLEAEQIERAAEIIRRFGLEGGPVGARLRELSAASS
jgi:tetratricopeptide (TPR) repeat protein